MESCRPRCVRFISSFFFFDVFLRFSCSPPLFDAPATYFIPSQMTELHREIGAANLGTAFSAQAQLAKDMAYRVTKVGARCGRLVDAITFIYSTPSGDEVVLKRGGNGGQEKFAVLNNDEFITRVVMRGQGAVDYLSIVSNRGVVLTCGEQPTGIPKFIAATSDPKTLVAGLFGKADASILRSLGVNSAPRLTNDLLAKFQRKTTFEGPVMMELAEEDVSADVHAFDVESGEVERAFEVAGGQGEEFQQLFRGRARGPAMRGKTSTGRAIAIQRMQAAGKGKGGPQGPTSGRWGFGKIAQGVARAQGAFAAAQNFAKRAQGFAGRAQNMINRVQGVVNQVQQFGRGQAPQPQAIGQPQPQPQANWQPQPQPQANGQPQPQPQANWQRQPQPQANWQPQPQPQTGRMSNGAMPPQAFGGNAQQGQGGDDGIMDHLPAVQFHIPGTGDERVVDQAQHSIIAADNNGRNGMASGGAAAANAPKSPEQERAERVARIEKVKKEIAEMKADAGHMVEGEFRTKLIDEMHKKAEELKTLVSAVTKDGAGEWPDHSIDLNVAAAKAQRIEAPKFHDKIPLWADDRSAPSWYRNLIGDDDKTLTKVIVRKAGRRLLQSGNVFGDFESKWFDETDQVSNKPPIAINIPIPAAQAQIVAAPALVNEVGWHHPLPADVT